MSKITGIRYTINNYLYTIEKSKKKGVKGRGYEAEKDVQKIEGLF